MAHDGTGPLGRELEAVVLLGSASAAAGYLHGLQAQARRAQGLGAGRCCCSLSSQHAVGACWANLLTACLCHQQPGTSRPPACCTTASPAERRVGAAGRRSGTHNCARCSEQAAQTARGGCASLLVHAQWQCGGWRLPGSSRPVAGATAPASFLSLLPDGLPSAPLWQLRDSKHAPEPAG